ncbi:helix-turn-helix domain-containing protein [Ligilactobacillus animalis]|uniref:helix-turn-helix domain-containing protein n=1 Tax=Ligilactobacillus animalis TaxID=1605 RepID=UPI003B984737
MQTLRLSENQLKALKRKRGELNYSVLELSKATGVSRWTLDKILKGHTNVQEATAKKVNDWIIKQYMND